MKTKTTFCPINVIKLGSLMLMISVFTSCISYKKIPYFQDLDKSQVTTEAITNMSLPSIQPMDQLSISVTSLNQDAANVFSNSIINAGPNSTSPVYGYIVDVNGNVNLPLVGAMKVQGLTPDELSAKLQQQLLTYLSKPTVYVRIVNFKVAVLGDVAHPNIYAAPSARFTITEALSMAGDLNITANRDDITLIREVDGKRTYIPINLLSKNLFQSPYFYLKANDLINVTPSKAKSDQVDTGYRNASLVISALSLIAIAISVIRR
jgi:polysaccharide export outer membrane protein